MSRKPVLYYATLSPPSRAVLLTAKEIGIEFELKPIDLLKREHLAPDFVKINPQHTIPTLVDVDGKIIYDSHAICSYLVEKYAKNDKLYPKDLIKRAQVNAKLYFDSGFLFPRFRFLYDSSIEYSVDKSISIQKTYDIMEAFLKDSPYVCGDNLTIADFCCIATISSMDEVAPIDSAKYLKLLAWMKRLSELPYYKSCNGDGAVEVKELLKTILGF